MVLAAVCGGVTCEVSLSPDSTAADLLEKLRTSPLIRSVEMRTPG